MTWFVEFTNWDGTTHTEPANCGTACGPECEYPDTEVGAQRFAVAGTRITDAAPPRVYQVADGNR